MDPAPSPPPNAPGGAAPAARRRTARLVLLATLLIGAGAAAYWARGEYRIRMQVRDVQKALDERDFARAATALRPAMEARPGDPDLRLLAARIARRRGDLAAAKEELRTHEALKGPAPARQLEERLLAVQQFHNPNEADALWDLAVQDPPVADRDLILEVVIAEYVPALETAYTAGMTLVEGPAGELRVRAERALELWLTSRPSVADRVQGFVWRGRVRKLTDQQQGSADFRSAIELDPNHLDARLRLAESLVEYNAREAIGHLELVLKREPGHLPAGRLLAHLRRTVGDLAGAAAVLDGILTAHPTDVPALAERGKVALEAGRPAEAEAFLQRAIARAPDDPALHLVLSGALHQLGNAAGAKAHQQRYRDLEAARLRAEARRSEEERAAWRRRVQQQVSPPGGSTP